MFSTTSFVFNTCLVANPALPQMFSFVLSGREDLRPYLLAQPTDCRSDGIARSPLICSDSVCQFCAEGHKWIAREFGSKGHMQEMNGSANERFANCFREPFVAPSNYQCDSPKVYQTRVLYEVFRSDDRTRFFEVGVGVPASQIFLIRNQFADDAY